MSSEFLHIPWYYIHVILSLLIRSWTSFNVRCWSPKWPLQSIQYSVQQTTTASLIHGRIPDDLYPGRTLRLLFFPLRLIPVQFIEHNHQGWYQIQMLIHPASLQDPFRNVPLVWRSLQTAMKLKSYLRTGAAEITYWVPGTLNAFISFSIHIGHC
jgi:hypothetical protein